MSHSIIRTIYLYLATFVGLILIVISLYNFLDLGLRATILKQADEVIIFPGTQPPSLMTSTMQPTDKVALSNQARQEYEQRQHDAQRERTISTNLALLIVGLPLYLYHWHLVKTESKK